MNIENTETIKNTEHVEAAPQEVKKKRGRRKKTDEPVEAAPSIVSEEKEKVPPVEQEEDTQKKRGRKPKGGKITAKPIDDVAQPTPIANIILHLKCSMNDLEDYNNRQIVKDDPYEYKPVVPSNVIMTYNDEQNSNHYGIYETSVVKNATAYPDDIPGDTNTPVKYTTTNTVFCPNCIDSADANDNLFIRDINNKLKKLKIQLYKNAIPDKKSSCFWCTYEFDNQACYIPKYEMDGSIFGYGSFCRPECAVAYLMRENIDDSTKFERYHLLNQIYSKVYGFKKNIKPAPNPYYMLDKYYGNLTIQEYRKLLKTEHMMLVIDKPMTRILPELHEDNEDLMANIYGGNPGKSATVNTTGVYKVKRQCDKQEGPSKSSIMKNKFGMA